MTMAVVGITAANMMVAGATVADMAAANTTTASSTAANTTPTSTTAVNMGTANTTATDTMATDAAAMNETVASTTVASMTAANTMTPTGATAVGMAAVNTTAAKATAANATAANTTAPSTMAANTLVNMVAASIMAADVMAANTMLVVGATTIGVGLWPMDMDDVEVVTIDEEGLEVATEVGRSIKALPDNKEEVSDNGSEDGEEYGANTICAEARRAVNAMLEDLRMKRTEMAVGSTPGDPLSGVDLALNLWNDRPALRESCTKLTRMCRDKSLDVVSRARITVMVGVLNLYLETELCYTWRNASLVVAKAQGQGTAHACNLRKWVLNFVQSGSLPLRHHGQPKSTILCNEDISQSLQLQLVEHTKRGHIKAADLVETISSPNMQENLRRIGVCKPTITEWMARDWLKKLDWRYEPKKNGMYIDGHE
ncbi:hypothetical protein EDB86DRAFT_3071149 [Lactarius hatsudake]|nr:hypothetical protein EDB86DRAFT_3071149 [Lactarius hatsudake]